VPSARRKDSRRGVFDLKRHAREIERAENRAAVSRRTYGHAAKPQVLKRP